MIPVVFHNLGYDVHFLIRELAASTKLEGKVSLIAENKEKYISFTKHIKGSKINYRFIDSFRFMPTSLEKLAQYLGDEKPITICKFEKEGLPMEKIKLLMEKGIYPYDYTTSFETLNEKELPPRECFYNKLNDTDVTDEDYKRAKTVWDVFDIKDVGSYSDLYLKTDVLLLADVFENFRFMCLQQFQLDAAYYRTVAAYSWAAMKKMTGVKLESITDIDILLFVERGIRGGISQCSHRYAKANNRYMEDDYDPTKEENFIIYLDANNLYGYVSVGKVEIHFIDSR